MIWSDSLESIGQVINELVYSYNIKLEELELLVSVPTSEFLRKYGLNDKVIKELEQYNIINYWRESDASSANLHDSTLRMVQSVESQGGCVVLIGDDDYVNYWKRFVTANHISNIMIEVS